MRGKKVLNSSKLRRGNFKKIMFSNTQSEWEENHGICRNSLGDSIEKETGIGGENKLKVHFNLFIYIFFDSIVFDNEIETQASQVRETNG